MSYHIIQPSASLAPYIHFYWLMDSRMKYGEQHWQRIVPTGLPELTFYFDDQPVYHRNDHRLKSYAVINGQHDGFYDVNVSGHLQLFSVIFKPFAVSGLFDTPISELRNLSSPAEDCIINIDQVAEKLYGTNSISGKIKNVENYLLKLLERSQSTDFIRLTSVFGRINKKFAQVSIDELASIACLSRKQFERVFTSHIGISPKRYLRILRFQSALHFQSANSVSNLANLAVSSGYFDQAHMISDFKTFTGSTPKKFFQDCTTQSDYFLSGSN